MPIFWRLFIINWCWILSKASSASIEMIIWVLSFNLLIWCITLIYLCILKNPCTPVINPTRSRCMIFWSVAEFCLLNFCSGFLHLCSSVILACSFLSFFFLVVVGLFWYQDDGGLIEWVWKCSFLCNFLKEF